MRITQPPLLRLMVVDIDKDWGGYKITNLGAPTAAKEALRYGDEALIDHEALKNYPDAKHLVLPAHIAAVLDDHNLTNHPLTIIPTMDDAHIPDLDGLSGYPATDPVAGIGGLRTLGAGAQQAAAGNHTHSLVADVSGSIGDKGGTSSISCKGTVNVPGNDSVTLLTKNIGTVAAISTVVGSASFTGYAGSLAVMKLRLFIAGVQRAESDMIGAFTSAVVLMGYWAGSSGSVTLESRVHNYSPSNYNLSVVSKTLHGGSVKA